jgi:hypothetical protein
MQFTTPIKVKDKKAIYSNNIIIIKQFIPNKMARIKNKLIIFYNL